MNFAKLKYFLLYISIVFFNFNYYIKAQDNEKIELISANSLKYDKFFDKNIKRLIGDVLLKQKDIFLKCDSAYFYTDENSVDAYGSVNIYRNIGAKFDVKANSLKYNGYSKEGLLVGNVRMSDDRFILYTDRLYYDGMKNIFSFNNGANIVDRENKLYSRQGTYNIDNNVFLFTTNVELISKGNTLKTDSLSYNYKSHDAYFLSSTTITSPQMFIYTDKGYYNTDNETLILMENNRIINEKKYIKADSILYLSNDGTSKLFRNIYIFDTISNIIITANYLYYEEKNNSGIITDKAIIQYLTGDDTMYVYADSFSISSNDKKRYSTVLSGWHNVKIYSRNIQGVADSISFTGQNECVTLYNNPVLWIDTVQFDAKLIDIQTDSNNNINNIYLLNRCYIMSLADNNIGRYNQIKGNNGNIIFNDNKPVFAFIDGNVETLYYIFDDNNKRLKGINKTKSEALKMKIVENKIERIILLGKPQATFYPPRKLSKNDRLIKGFLWKYETDCPKTKFDILN